MKRRSGVAAGVLAVLVCSSCALPSQPVRHPVGLAQVDRTIVVLVPACSDVQVDSVIFAPGDGASPIDESQWWTASGYIGSAAGSAPAAGTLLLTLDPAHWERSTGPLPDWTRPFSVDVVTEGDAYAGVADEEDVRALGELHGGYLVDGEVMGGREFLEAEGPADCPEPHGGGGTGSLAVATAVPLPARGYAWDVAVVDRRPGRLPSR